MVEILCEAQMPTNSLTTPTISRDPGGAAPDLRETTAAPGGTPVESAAGPKSAPFDLQGRTVLLAMDGSAGAAAGARVALALATASGAVIRVLHVIDSRAVPFPPALDIALAIEDADRDLTSHQKEVQVVRSSLAAITGRVIDWPIRVAIGAPSVTIVDEAFRVDAALVIVGLHKYGRIDRALNNETSLNVIRRCNCPVLGVVPGTTELPTHILAATDFSPVSMAATRAARAIANRDAAFVLAYVPPITALLGDEGERTIHDFGVRAAFAQATQQLGAEGLTFDHVVLQHDLSFSTAATLLRHAEKTNCDLIAAGSARQSHLERWIIGSVSTELVRDGSRSVLIVPPSRI
jgi:nucleotide-binding universal stress UspA family protein